jgi:hypothetical protein
MLGYPGQDGNLQVVGPLRLDLLLSVGIEHDERVAVCRSVSAPLALKRVEHSVAVLKRLVLDLPNVLLVLAVQLLALRHRLDCGRLEAESQEVIFVLELLVEPVVH